MTPKNLKKDVQSVLPSYHGLSVLVILLENSSTKSLEISAKLTRWIHKHYCNYYNQILDFSCPKYSISLQINDLFTSLFPPIRFPLATTWRHRNTCASCAAREIYVIFKQSKRYVEELTFVTLEMKLWLSCLSLESATDNWIELKRIKSLKYISAYYRGGSRIPRRRGRQSSGGRQHTILPNFPKNCMKLKEFGPPGGGARPLRPPLDPSLL